MDTPDTEKLERFKARIGFDRALQAERQDRHAVVTWPDMLQAPGITGGGWQIAADTTMRESGGNVRSWVLRRGAETVSIVAFVSPEGSEAARQFLLLQAGDNMMVDVPFQQGPAGLGTLSLSHPKPGYQLLWVYLNVVLGVRAIATQIDILPIARWLQAYVDNGLVPRGSPQLKPPLVIEIAPRRAKVGEPIDVAVRDSEKLPEGRYMMKIDLDRNAMRIASQQGLKARVAGITPGSTAIDVHAIDTATLLSVTTHADLQLDPPAARP